jgi:Zn-dependent protease with chaperone function/tetratricopeptide (TPR) repeat protein
MQLNDLLMVAIGRIDLSRLPAIPFVVGVTWIVVATSWLSITAVFCVVGLPENRVAEGTSRRLVLTSALLAFIAMAPGIVLALCITANVQIDAQFLIAGASIIISIAFINRYLMPPLGLVDSARSLPLIRDEKLLIRIEEIAATMHVAMPVVRLCPSLGDQMTVAYAGTIQAPQIVVSDGILHRLEPIERDAIIAHELAHIANGSLWSYVSRFPCCAALTTAAVLLVPEHIAILFGLAVQAGLIPLLSRPIEFDCDRRAARVVGFGATASALAKIHAIHPTSKLDWWSLLVFATARHPSRDARIAALLAVAPTDDRPKVVVNLVAAKLSGRLAYAAFLVWAVVLLSVSILVLRGHDTIQLVIPLIAVSLAPKIFLKLAYRKQAAIEQRQLDTRGRHWEKILLLAVVCLSVVIAILFALRMPDIANLLLPVPPVIILGWLIGKTARNTQPKLLQKMLAAMQVHDFETAIRLCKDNPKAVSQSHLIRYSQAICYAAMHDFANAISLLEQLRVSHPEFSYASLLLAILALESNQCERAIEIVGSIAEKLPDNPSVPMMQARAYRRLGHMDEVQAACDRLRKIDSDNAYIYAIEAAIALHHNEIEVARDRIKQALDRLPGDPSLLIIDAEIELQSATSERWNVAVERAIQSVRTNPLAFRDVDIDHLQALAAKRSESVNAASNSVD